jgi:hypothetical protein
MVASQMHALAGLLFGSRLLSLRRFWRLPFQQGAGWCFTTQVEPGFAGGAGAGFLRRYRLWLLAPFVLDVGLIPLLLLSGRAAYLFHVQTGVLVLTAVYYNLVFYQFAYQAKDFAVPSTEPPVTAAQLVMAPRRWRDHTNWLVETALLVGLLLAITLFGRRSSEWQEQPLAFWSLIWVLYLQAGLFLLKLVFIHWRIKLPLRRTEEFRRWRAAWLTYHLRVIDAVRLVLATLLLVLAVRQAFGASWQMDGMGLGVLAVFVLFIVYCSRESRRVQAVQREVQPMTLASEFPPTPIAEGRFFAGGLLYFNSDNPLALVRSPQGLAFNLANPATCLWIAYLFGFIWLLVWQISRAAN